MSKELEALERLYCSGNLQLDYVLSNKHQQDYESIEKALHRLEAIENSNPNKALECVEVLKEDGCITTLYQGKALETIRQALLKAQEQEKQYLKWEDLEFSYGTKTQKVRMSGTIYKIVYANYDNTKEAQLLSEDEKLLYVCFVGKYKDNVQLFNDLHLERIDEDE